MSLLHYTRISNEKILAVAAITATMLSVGTGAYAATYVNGEDVTNEVFTTISNDYTLFPMLFGREAWL